MNTNTREAQQLLRLFKCVVDTGTNVLTAFAEYKLLQTYNGNFQLFIDDKNMTYFISGNLRSYYVVHAQPQVAT